MRAVIHYYGGVCHLVPTSMRNEMSFASNYPTLDFAQNGQNIICIMERLAKTADIKKRTGKLGRERGYVLLLNHFLPGYITWPLSLVILSFTSKNKSQHERRYVGHYRQLV